MMEILKNILVSLAIGFIFAILQNLLESKILVVFLKNNLITIEITMLAINSATLGIVLTKIREIIDKIPDKSDFSRSKEQMLISVKEQIMLIIFSSVILILVGSCIINKLQNDIISLSFNALLIACFVYAVLILFDVAKSVFVLLDFKPPKKIN